MAFKHGKYKTPEFAVWQRMIRRCYEPQADSYPFYGARGISVCTRWRESFQSFLNDVGPRPSPRHSIERINNDGNYEPDNVRWATHIEQCRNRRSTRLYTYKGQTRCIKEWAAIVGLKTGTLQWRLNHGWSIEQALIPSLCVNQFDSIKEPHADSEIHC